VGFQSAEQKRGIYAYKDGEVKALSEMIGRLDGVFELADGTILATDWNTGSVFHWSKAAGMEPLAPGFKGPADFCVRVDAHATMASVMTNMTALTNPLDFCIGTSYLLAVLAMKLTTARIRNTKNRIFAIPAAPAAMPAKPNTAAMSAMTKKMTA